MDGVGVLTLFKREERLCETGSKEVKMASSVGVGVGVGGEGERKSFLRNRRPACCPFL